jgi:hypothetical protein
LDGAAPEAANSASPFHPIKPVVRDPSGKDGTALVVAAVIARWWTQEGRGTHPGASRLLAVVDFGGSQAKLAGSLRHELGALAQHIALPITAMHLPAGTYRWNQIESEVTNLMTMASPEGEPVWYQTELNVIGDGIRPCPRPANRPDTNPTGAPGTWSFTVQGGA